jgi:NAD(P)-dependent dehydrogenase (short-subunit alcohol dehydrogenase family)
MRDTIKYLIGAAGPSGFGSKSTAEDVTAHCCLNSVTAIITGATSGIGAETARMLAKRGARIIIPARNKKLAKDVKAGIQRETPGAEIVVLELDLSSFASIRRFVEKFESLALPLNILINNAGKFCQELELSEDGFEMTFATNHLGHFLLTKLLLNKMIETAKETQIEGRIINVSSVVHGWLSKTEIQFHQLKNPKSFNGTRAYAISKLANILHAKELASQLKILNANVTANAIHPGIVRTAITRGHNEVITDSIFFLASKLLKTLPQAASTACYAAVHPSVAGVSGKYFADCNETSCSSLANDPSQAAELWRISEAMIGHSQSPKS